MKRNIIFVCLCCLYAIGAAGQKVITGTVGDTVRNSYVIVNCDAVLPDQDKNLWETGVCFSASVSEPTINDNVRNTNVFSWWETSYQNCSFSVVLAGLEDNSTFYYRNFAKTIKGDVYYGEVRKFTVCLDVKEYPQEYVDLGLSVKWATCNIGAHQPEDPGDYFAWGETQPKYESLTPLVWKDGITRGYSLEQYFDQQRSRRLYIGTSKQSKFDMSFEKYSIDLKTQLEKEDDAAQANWGGDWRMPTDAECTELLKNCTWTWTSRNGICGYEVKSNLNGNSIFLPAAGDMFTAQDRLQNLGFYWSSSLSSGYSYSASVLYLSQYMCRMQDNDREPGYSIRPVHP